MSEKYQLLLSENVLLVMGSLFLTGALLRAGRRAMDLFFKHWGKIRPALGKMTHRFFNSPFPTKPPSRRALLTRAYFHRFERWMFRYLQYYILLLVFLFALITFLQVYQVSGQLIPQRFLIILLLTICAKFFKNQAEWSIFDEREARDKIAKLE